MFSFFASLVQAKLLPAEDELSSENTHCDYEKYKGRAPDLCPRIENVEYGVTVYGNDSLQKNMREYLLLQLTEYKSKSSHSPVVLKAYNSFRLSSKEPNNYYENLIPKRDTLSLQYGIRIVKEGHKFIVYSTIIFMSSKSSNVVSNVSDLMDEQDVELYLKGVIDTHLRNVFLPQIFKDGI